MKSLVIFGSICFIFAVVMGLVWNINSPALIVLWIITAFCVGWNIAFLVMERDI